MARHLVWYAVLRPARQRDWAGLLLNGVHLVCGGLVLLLAVSSRTSALWAWWRRCVEAGGSNKGQGGRQMVELGRRLVEAPAPLPPIQRLYQDSFQGLLAMTECHKVTIQ